MDGKTLAKYIDHTLLKSDATPDDITRLCDEAIKYGFATVCVNTMYVAQAKEHLKDTGVKVCAVVGFPLGAMLRKVKAFETLCAIQNGADEIDTVVQVGNIKAKRYQQVEEDIVAVTDAAKIVPVKVILETHLLNQAEKIIACKIASTAGAAFVKTSTGFTGGGATVEDIELMKKYSFGLKIKASGGIRTLNTALAMIEAGVDRLGISASVSIMGELENECISQ